MEVVYLRKSLLNSFGKPKPHTKDLAKTTKHTAHSTHANSLDNPIQKHSLLFTTMANAHSVSFLAICSIMLVISSSAVVDAGGDRHHHHHNHHLGLGLFRTKSTCEGSIAECLGGDEFDLDSEINRRILATSQYISYGALQRNTVPCSRRGASYYNCRPGAQANPYNRGCSAITRCRS